MTRPVTDEARARACLEKSEQYLSQGNFNWQLAQTYAAQAQVYAFLALSSEIGALPHRY